MKEKHQILPEKRYERSMNHNYMVLGSYNFFGQEEEETDYTARMLLGNKIPGLLPVECRKNVEEKQYYYEINSLQSFDRLYEKQEIGYEALYKLLSRCIHIFEHLEEYLLDGTQIILNPEYIYIHIDTNEPFLVCYPEYHCDIRYSFMMLMDYLLTKINHTQEQTVWLAYQVYRYTRNPNYVLGEIKELLFEAEEMKEASRKEESNYEADPVIEGMRKYHINDKIEEAEKRELYINDVESDDENADDYNGNTKWSENHSWSKNILGALLCTLLALSATGIIFGARLLKLIPLSQNQEISLYGAIGMSVVAAVIFFRSLVKRWKQETQIEKLSVEHEEEIEYWEQDMELHKESKCHSKDEHRTIGNLCVSEQRCRQHTSQLAGETVLLNHDFIQERFLQGNINGEEIRVPLRNFPLILGKLTEFSDFVIHDNTVSRMHARLDQRNGKIYISDLNSTNGTMRNGDMLAMNEEVVLEPGDKIMLGRVCFTYC